MVRRLFFLRRAETCSFHTMIRVIRGDGLGSINFTRQVCLRIVSRSWTKSSTSPTTPGRGCGGCHVPARCDASSLCDSQYTGSSVKR